MFCSRCGNEIPEGSAFCGKCGTPVGGAPTGRGPATGEASTQQGTAAGAAPGWNGAAADVSPTRQVVATSSVSTHPTSTSPAPKKKGVKIGVIAAAVVVVLLVVIGVATKGFGFGGVQPKEAVDVPAANQEQSADSQDAASGLPVKSAVEAYSWDELSQISAEIAAAGDEVAGIEVAKKYNLCTPEGKLDGTQVKSVTLTDGTQTTVQIIGFNHDDKTGGGKAGITFMLGESIADRSMNSSDTNAGGWEASQSRAYLNSEGLALLPQELSSNIVAVDKLSNNVGETELPSSVTATSDSLWLFSLVELGGPMPESRIGSGYGLYEEAYANVFDAAGRQYKLFQDTSVSMTNSDNKMLIKTSTDTYSYWWLRTADARGSYSFLRVDQHGALPSGADGASYHNGVVPGFCI